MLTHLEWLPFFFWIAILKQSRDIAQYLLRLSGSVSGRKAARGSILFQIVIIMPLNYDIFMQWNISGLSAFSEDFSAICQSILDASS